MKLGLSAERNVNKRAVLYLLYHILFQSGRTATFLTVSTIPGAEEYLPNDAAFQLKYRWTPP